MPLVKRFINWLQIAYGFKDAPKHFVWERYPEQPQQPEPNVQPPIVEVKPLPVSVRQVAHFHKMRLELLPEDWLNNRPVQHTEPINVSEIITQPVERDTDVTMHTALVKLKHTSKVYDR